MSSLHQQLSRNAPKALQGMMKDQVDIDLPSGFTVSDRGNHYIVRKGHIFMNVPLFASREVFKALRLFA